MNKFTIVNDKYELKEGEVLTTFKLSNSDKKYVLYTSTDFNYMEMALLVGILEQNEGKYYIKNIDNNKEKQLIINQIRTLLGGSNG